MSLKEKLKDTISYALKPKTLVLKPVHFILIAAGIYGVNCLDNYLLVRQIAEATIEERILKEFREGDYEEFRRFFNQLSEKGKKRF